MKDSFDRQLEVDDLGQGEAEQRQEEALGGLAQVAIFHRRPADERGRIHGASAMTHGGDVEDGIAVNERVVAGVIAERSLVPFLAALHVAF